MASEECQMCAHLQARLDDAVWRNIRQTREWSRKFAELNEELERLRKGRKGGLRQWLGSIPSCVRRARQTEEN